MTVIRMQIRVTAHSSQQSRTNKQIFSPMNLLIKYTADRGHGADAFDVDK